MAGLLQREDFRAGFVTWFGWPQELSAADKQQCAEVYWISGLIGLAAGQSDERIAHMYEPGLSTS